MSDMQKHLLPEWRREIARLQTENEALRARVAGMKTLADNVELDGSFTPEDVRDMLVDAVNLAWSQNGNNARCTVTANFIGWILLENDRLRVRVAELELEVERLKAELRIAYKLPAAVAAAMDGREKE